MKRSLLFIVDSMAAELSRKGIEKLIDRITDRECFNFRVEGSNSAGHAAIIAAQADEDVIVAVGDDAMVNGIAASVMEKGRTLGIVPCGDGNGLARHLGISTDPEKALRQLNEASEKLIDSAVIDGMRFFSTCGVGLDADVVMACANRGKRGFWNIFRTVLRLWKSFVPQIYTLVLDDRTVETRALLISVGNSNQWGNNAWITPEADLSDGFLDITVAEPLGLLQLPYAALLLMTGRLYQFRKVRHMRCKTLVIKREKEDAVQVDGSTVLLGKEIHIEIMKHSLKVLA